MKKSLLVLCLIAFQFISFASPPDTIKNELYAWKLTDGFLEEPATLDTTIDYFQMYNLVERQSICYSYLGNIGSPWKTNIYFSESGSYQTDFIFDINYKLYVLSSDNMLFYHAKKPYFDLSWATGTKKRDENQLSALYTQNINKKWNIGIRYKLISSLGEIPRSKVAEHSLYLFTSYKGEKYSMHAAFDRNRFKNEESGGVNDTLSTTPEFAEALLSKAFSVYFKRDFFISQQYKFGFTEKIVVDDTTTETKFHELGRLNYILKIGKYYRIYDDDQTDAAYYRNTYFEPINSSERIDSINQMKFENIIYWTFKEIKRENFNGRLTIGGAHEYLMSSQIDKSYAYFKQENYSNIKLTSNLDARTKNFIFTVYGYYYPKITGTDAHKSGSYYGNVLIDKAIKVGKWKPDFYFNLSHSSLKPNLFEQNYTSIHFRWYNEFKNRVYTEFKSGFKIPQILIDAEVAYGINQNEIYYDTLAYPKQFDDFITVGSVRLQKDFNLKGLRINNKVVYQRVNNQDEILSLPKWSIYHSLFYDLDYFLEKLSIEAQLGYELYYTSKFYAPGFMPSSSVFYQQRIRQTGEYPLINVFLNMRIKTVLLFFKFENLCNKLVIKKNYYYYTNNYPINTIAFKFGVSWRFMD